MYLIFTSLIIYNVNYSKTGIRGAMLFNIKKLNSKLQKLENHGIMDLQDLNALHKTNSPEINE